MPDARIAVVGATGAVGGVLRGILAERGYDDVRYFASARSAGSQLDGRPVEEATPEALEALDADFAFFAVGMVTSAVVGYFTVKYFIRFLAAHRLDVFAWYRVALALVTFAWLAAH